MLAIVILAALAVVAAHLDPAPPPVAGMGRASDGDSFRLGEDRIRLLGLDAPELAQQCDTATGDKWACGQVARDRLADLLASGAVDCAPEDTDRYGRLLARCQLAESDLGAVLVSEGLAIAAGSYWQQESAAKQARLGIWQGGFQRPRDWRDDHPRGQGVLGWLGL